MWHFRRRTWVLLLILSVLISVGVLLILVQRVLTKEPSQSNLDHHDRQQPPVSSEPVVSGSQELGRPATALETLPAPRLVVFRELPWKSNPRGNSPDVQEAAKRFWLKVKSREWKLAENAADEICCLLADLGETNFKYRNWRTLQEDVSAIQTLPEAIQRELPPLRPEPGVATEQTLHIFEKHLPGSFAEAIWLNQSSIELFKAGQGQKALERVLRAIKIAESRIGPDHEFTGNALENATYYAGKHSESIIEVEGIARRSLINAVRGRGYDIQAVFRRLHTYLDVLKHPSFPFREVGKRWRQEINQLEQDFGQNEDCFHAIYFVAGYVSLQNEEPVSALMWLGKAYNKCDVDTALGEYLIAVYLNKLGEILEVLDRYDLAFQKYEEAECRLTTRQPSNTKQQPDFSFLLLATQNNLAINVMNRGLYLQAELRFQQVLAHPLCTDEFRVNTLRQMAMNAIHMEQPEKARNFVEEALCIFGDSPDLKKRAQLHTLLGNVYRQSGAQWDMAELEYRCGLEIYEQIGALDNIHVAIARQQLAEVLLAQGRLEEALGFAKKSLDYTLTTHGPHSRLTAYNHQALGRILNRQGDLEGALSHMREADRIFAHRLGLNHPESIQIRLDLVDHLASIHRFSESLSLLKEVDSSVKSNNVLPIGVLITFQAITANLLASIRDPQAEHEFDKAISYADSAGSAENAIVIRLHLVQHLLRTSETSEPAIQRTNQLHRIENELKKIPLNLDSFAQATRCFATLLRVRYYKAVGELALAEKLLNSFEGKDGKRAMVLEPQFAVLFHRLRGAIAIQRKDFESAEKSLHTAEEAIRQARKHRSNSLMNLSPIWNTDSSLDLAAVLVKLNKPVQAFEALERGLARNLTEVMTRRNEPQGRILCNISDLQKQIANDQAVVGWLDGGPNLGVFAYIIRQTGPPQWVELKLDSRPEKLLRQAMNQTDLLKNQNDRVQALTKTRMVWLDPLVEHFGAREQLTAVTRLVVVLPGPLSGIPLEAMTDAFEIRYTPSLAIFAFPRPTPQKLDKPIIMAFGNPKYGQPKTVETIPEKGVLIREISPQLQEKVDLQPGDVLTTCAGFPINSEEEYFAALGQTVRDGKPEIEVELWRNGVRKKFSTSRWESGLKVSSDPLPKAMHDFLRANRPTWTVIPPQDLKWAEKELAIVSAGYQKISGSECNRLRWEAELAEGGSLSKANLVYVLTHSRANPFLPFESSFVLAPAPGTTAMCDEFAAKNLDGKKVSGVWFLGGCGTGLGPRSRSEGLQGFAEILLAQGAWSVIVSLWDVDDLATALLTIRFHETIAAQKFTNPGRALEESKKWLRNLSFAQLAKLSDRLRLAKPEQFSTEVGPPEEGGRPYADPRYWAAFIYIGQN